MTIHQILVKYWGHSSFRQLQEEIINSVLDGNDTLALLPTGGGKSICFQVPALAKNGICIVISPLIALMKDQVYNLKKRGINAIAIHSGLSKEEIDISFDNCIYGNIKFLYLSPERLNTDMAITRIKKMKVNLLAIDEAHCISEWGYDFRPPYLQIAQFREHLPGVPVLALTATATPEVVIDIQDKLNFEKPLVFQKSFERKNLTYFVIKEEDKYKRLLKIANKVKGTGIVYVRNRNKTKEIALFLRKNQITAENYHAGISTDKRDIIQNKWITGKTRIIVATNAFGMGIDKSNVRFVIHLDIPNNIEAYFQEAGRAGRDEKQAFGVILYNNDNIDSIKKNYSDSFPPIKTIKKVYQSIGNYYQLAIGSGKDISFDIDISDFCNKYNLSIIETYYSFSFLEKEGYLTISESTKNSSKIHFKVDKNIIYRFQVKNPKYDAFIKLLLRSYTGVFTNYIKIDENQISKRIGLKIEIVENALSKLDKFGILTYIKRTKKPQLTFLTERIDTKSLIISKDYYNKLKKRAKIKSDAVINYVTNENKCRNQLLLNYFGDNNAKRCGKCDICLERNKLELSEFEFDNVLNQIKPLLTSKGCSLNDLIDSIPNTQEEKILKVVRWLLDHNKIVLNSNKKYTWII